MKKQLLSLLIFISAAASAQDSTKVIGLQLNARTIECLVPVVLNPQNEEHFDVFLKWRTAFRKNNLKDNDMVVTDTIATTVVAVLYDALLGNPEGYGGIAHMKTQLTSHRAANPYLNTLCNDLEALYAERVV